MTYFDYDFTIRKYGNVYIIFMLLYKLHNQAVNYKINSLAFRQ